jgi:uncharacterized protein (TIGR02145 family)
MLSPRLTNCPECANIPSLLRKIDCKLAELGNSLYNNISYMLNQPIAAGDILQLIAYRRILLYKYINPNYAYKYSVNMIASRVIRLTVGCVSKCNTPEPCLEVPCNITIVENPTTTTTSSSSSTTTTTTTTCAICCDVTIGTQIWTSCNLDVTIYRDGTLIPEVQDQTTWGALTTGAWCYYNNDSANGPVYGKLYNWYAVNDPRGLAPVGYHVPTDAEWTTLTDLLGGENVAGGEMKETGTTHWTIPNQGATNSSGFTALPGGFRTNVGGTFFLIDYYGFWWSSSEYNTANAWIRILYYINTLAYRVNLSKARGYSVRLIKD